MAKSLLVVFILHFLRSHVQASGCPLPPLWDCKVNTAVTGADSATGVTTKANCLSQCVSNPACKAVDMDSNSSATFCWIHTTSDLTQTRLANNVKHCVLKDRCLQVAPTTACGEPSWSTYANARANGGTDYPAILDADTCREQCVSDSKCVGVDIDQRPSATTLCWLHLSQANLATRVAGTGITHQVLLDRCPPPAVAPTEKDNQVLSTKIVIIIAILAAGVFILVFVIITIYMVKKRQQHTTDENRAENINGIPLSTVDDKYIEQAYPQTMHENVTRNNMSIVPDRYIEQADPQMMHENVTRNYMSIVLDRYIEQADPQTMHENVTRNYMSIVPDRYIEQADPQTMHVNITPNYLSIVPDQYIGQADQTLTSSE